MFLQKKIWLTEFLFIIMAAVFACSTNAQASHNGYLSCHHGIADIKDPDSPMMLQIKLVNIDLRI
ncbi:hypothetical protein MNBD_DELTA04-46 [hydrothermal vent metagenome]|uniref:Uncharacterized protein n=1 Tax=hydrothermal vent metagenome TaxID=652676 RepID=A0A3B0VH97_9ZZZZ